MSEWSKLSADGGCSAWSGIKDTEDCNEWDSWRCWILDTGKWSDTCYWKDTSFWNDGVPFWSEAA